MKRIIDFVISLFISPEFLWIIFSWFIYYKYNAFIITVFDSLVPKLDFIKYLALLPIGLTCWVFNNGKTLIFPKKDTKEILQDWKNYWKLKIIFFIALFYSLLFSIIGLLAWGLIWERNSYLAVVLLLQSTIGSGIVFFTFYNAIITINELFVKNKKVLTRRST